MEHKIIDDGTDELTIYTENDKPTGVCCNTYGNSSFVELTHNRELTIVKALLPKILERGDLDALIKTWIEQNMLDGDPMDDCGECVAHMKPNDMYELVYDCVDGIMES